MTPEQTYDDELHGALFKNDEKTTERQPDYRGKAQVRGEWFWIAAWIKQAKSGRKYLSLELTPKEQQQPDSQHKGDDDAAF